MKHSISRQSRQLLARVASVLSVGAMMGSALPVRAQQSVGRDWPMAESADWVGAGVPFYNIDAATAKDGAAPDGITALARDIFTSDDFYVDRQLWRDPRYFRCNSTLGGGDYSSAPTYITDDARKGAWGHCDVDYPREHIVSPYGFPAARAHYEALLAESRAKRGPTQYSRERMPPHWDGRYTNNVSVVFGLMRAGKAPVVPKELSEPPQWIIGYHNQIPTILSLLTPEYQQRLVQQLYHQAHDHAAQWSAMLCRPEGFMRWWSGPGGPGSLDVTVTPSRVQFLGGSGEIFTPRSDAQGKLLGLEHEAVFYDEEGLVQPIRNVRFLARQGDFNDVPPNNLTHCNQTLFVVNGRATPLVPGAQIQYRVEDLFGRPWAAVWEEYFEQGMQRPKSADLFDFERE